MSIARGKRKAGVQHTPASFYNDDRPRYEGRLLTRVRPLSPLPKSKAVKVRSYSEED